MKRLITAGLFVLLTIGLVNTASAAKNSGMLDYDEFFDEMLAHVGKYNIKQDQIERVSFVERVEGGRRGLGRVASLEYWLRLTTCSGYVVVELNAAGRVMNSYSRGDCKFDGLQSFK
jgi:hypothetical protein